MVRLLKKKESHNEVIGFVVTMKEGSSPISLMQENKVQSMIHSGENRHMLSNQEDFIQYKPCNGKVPIGKQGSKVSLIWENNGILKKKNHQKFSICKGKDEIFNGNIRNGLLEVDFDYDVIDAQVSEHGRLGHIGQTGNCEACKSGKTTRSSFKKDLERTKVPLEELSVDLMGPMSPTSIGGSNFVLAVVNTATRFSWVRFLKSKDKAKEKLIKIINKAENRLEKSVKRILTNGEKEFVNKFISKFCANRRIENITTSPYTPQHNGIVESLNRTLLDKARAMRVETGVPKELWAELINTAVYLRVRTSLGGISPWENIFNIKPNLKRIKRFGCRAWVATNSYKKKFDNRAEKGILVGYEPKWGVYRVFLEEKQVVIQSRDVRFDEDELPLMSKAVDNTEQIEYGSFKQIEPEDKTVIPALEDTQEIQINTPVSPLETTQTQTKIEICHVRK
ncbi:hypothetical protein O181_004902 [Austropuccinia psidii MF-1]|uniref:Integrase catalytic domain-containing protein n=1 Tax=Austropuccinia psidii MF-1 TaxID=1389203 RepID=A0A9Q3BH62_9BASI|nr:hypothetical protein [Austropuccinia psidii MF-1]